MILGQSWIEYYVRHSCNTSNEDPCLCWLREKRERKMRAICTEERSGTSEREECKIIAVGSGWTDMDKGEMMGLYILSWV